MDHRNVKDAPGDQIEFVNSKTSSTEIPGAGNRMTGTKWLAIIALGLNYMTSFQQGACTGAIVKSIDESLGPTTYYNWILTASTISATISLPLSGGLSDIFGRRWFFLIGGALSLIGAIVSLCAQDIPTMIAGAGVAGLGTGSQQLALAAVAELVPNSKRGIAQACLDLLVLPWSVFGALTGGAMVVYHGKYGYRINYIIGVVLNASSIIAAFIWYHPPTRGLRLGTMSKLQALKELDFIGVLLMNSGVILLLIAIGIGGTTVPWDSAGFIAPIVISVILLGVFWLWEAYFAKKPFFDHDLFRGKLRTVTIFLIIDFVAGMGLYASLAFWAQAVRGIFEGSPLKVGVLTLPGGFGGAVGGFAAGMLLGKHKAFATNWCLVYGTSMITLADFIFTMIEPSGPHSISWSLGMGFLAIFGVGFTSVSLIVCIQLAVPDKDLGLATLLLGSIRAVGGSVAITIYSALLTNVLQNDAGTAVAEAVIPLNLTLTSITPLVVELVNENYDTAAALPGVTPEILSAARQALKHVWTKGFHHVYFAAAAFAAVSLIAAIFSKDVSHNMTEHVAAHLENDKPALPAEDRLEKNES